MSLARYLGSGGPESANPEANIQVEWWSKTPVPAASTISFAARKFKVAISGRKRWVDEVPRSSVALVGLKTAQIKVKGPISGWWLSLERDSAALWESL